MTRTLTMALVSTLILSANLNASSTISKEDFKSDETYTHKRTLKISNSLNFINTDVEILEFYKCSLDNDDDIKFKILGSSEKSILLNCPKDFNTHDALFKLRMIKSYTDSKGEPRALTQEIYISASFLQSQEGLKL